MQRQQHI